MKFYSAISILSLVLMPNSQCDIIDSGQSFNEMDPFDMGSYSHSQKANIANERWFKSTSRSNENYSFTTSSECHVSQSQAMAYLKRIILSLIDQMNIKSHVFGPGETLTIDLQAFLSYEDYEILKNFTTSNNSDIDKLEDIDDIISELLYTVSQPPGTFKDYFKLERLFSYELWLIMITGTVFFFLLSMFSYNMVSSRHSTFKVILNAFILLFLVSILWNFAYLQENEKAINAAHLEQYDNPPRDCDYDNLSYFEGLSYFFRTKIFGNQDRCEIYHKEKGTSTFYRTNPMDAFQTTLTKLLFGSLDYIGTQLGKLLSGVVTQMPLWLQPLLILTLPILILFTFFSYRIRTPFFSIEPQPPPPNAPISYTPIHPPLINNCTIDRISSINHQGLNNGHKRDMCTSTDDLEEFILKQAESAKKYLPGPGREQNQMPPKNYTQLVIDGVYLVKNLVIVALRLFLKLLRESPSECEIYEDNEEQFFEIENVGEENFLREEIIDDRLNEYEEPNSSLNVQLNEFRVEKRVLMAVVRPLEKDLLHVERRVDLAEVDVTHELDEISNGIEILDINT